MAARTRYLLTYDIREPRRLRRVHQVAKDFGDPLQYSVFVCDLTEIELLDLKSEFLSR
jgi:CRISPR-associated protein Cas2